jgi:hypothetical protein
VVLPELQLLAEVLLLVFSVAVFVDVVFVVAFFVGLVAV